MPYRPKRPYYWRRGPGWTKNPYAASRARWMGKRGAFGHRTLKKYPYTRNWRSRYY